MKYLQIGKRKIGLDYRPFIIAEAGINHAGSIDKAIQLVDAAVQAKADCVKFQCHITEAEMIPTDMRPSKLSKKSLWDIIKQSELTDKEERRIKKYCEKKRIIYLCTPFSREAADRLEAMNVLAFKIGSGECNNLPLLEHIAKKAKPIIISTGMNDLMSIKKSLELIKRFNCPVMLMHCTSVYPTPYRKVRLGAIRELQEVFDLPVGLSDHSLGIYTCLGAVSLGAVALEKHFTISRKWSGPDISISIEPDELIDLVKGSRVIWQARGGGKKVLSEERPIISFAYASVVSLDNIKRGERLTDKNVWVKRPGTGQIRACHFQDLLGKKAKKDIKKNAQLQWSDFE